MHLDGWTVRGLAHPNVQILSLARLEEENIVAVVEFGEFVELVEFRLGIELCIFSGMRKKGVKIIQKVTMSVPQQKPSEFLQVKKNILQVADKPYLKVTPLEVSISTLCLFFLIPLLATSALGASDLDNDL